MVITYFWIEAILLETKFYLAVVDDGFKEISAYFDISGLSANQIAQGVSTKFSVALIPVTEAYVSFWISWNAYVVGSNWIGSS